MSALRLPRFPAAIWLPLVLVLWADLHGKAQGAENAGPENARMANSPSPYLKLHSTDLVRWHSWGPDAFALAANSNRPLMVSFGYSACHWCHVMQETHFNVPATAKYINDNFVPVLVDRERRPTLDETYMLVTEALTQRGGWPNTVFMTPDLKPFYGTSYIPREPFDLLLAAVSEGWKSDQEGLTAEGERVATLLTRYMTRKEAARELTAQLTADTAQGLAASFDPVTGGMGQGPKFFRQPVLMFLLQQAFATGDPGVLNAVVVTLNSALAGGVHDHIEGGFHRYTVDPGWRIPHFEKMLYDQGLMAEAYAIGYQATGNPAYAATLRKTLDYILADLTAPEGGFYATRDADSEGEEGTYYVWTPAQLEAALGGQDAAHALQIFGTIDEGEFKGKIIVNLDGQVGPVPPRITEIFRKLAIARSPRPKPHRDEKIIAAWNGMTIAGFATASMVLNEARYGEAALRAGEFIWQNMRMDDGRLMRSHYDGAAHIDGELVDYGQVARGFLFLFDLTADRRWLTRAKTLAKEMFARFEDPDNGDFFATANVQGFGRIKPRGDADQPSGNGMALDVIVRLARRSADPDYKRRAEKTIAALSGLAIKSPTAGASVMAATDRFLRGQDGMVQYSGNGAVRVTAKPATGNERVVLQVEVAEGWHINAEKPLEDYLIPTRLAIKSGAQNSDAEISFPQPQIKDLAFSKKPMALLEGRFDITAQVKTSTKATGQAELQVQACSDEICLEPETLILPFAWPAAR